MEKAVYRTPQEVKAELRPASILKGGLVVFNIAGNKYRVILVIDYERQIGFIRFVGTHASTTTSTRRLCNEYQAHS